jgi:GABA(A) receptor-associated protein
MISKKSFKQIHDTEARKNESLRIMKKYPGRIPVIVEIREGSTLPAIDKCKFLVPDSLTFGHLQMVIRKRLQLQPEIAMFIFINNTIASSSALLSQIYKENRDREDDFLYLLVSGESTFGYS